MKETCVHSKFEILSEELGNEELSADIIVEEIQSSAGKRWE